MVHELNVQLRRPHICNWVMLFQLTVSRPHAEMASAVAWLGTCLHIYLVAIGLSFRAIPHHCWDRIKAQEWGSTPTAWLWGKRQVTFCLAPADLDFAPPKGAGRLRPATHLKCHILGMEPSICQSTDEFWSPTPTQGWSIHPAAPSLLGLCVITNPYGDWHGGQGP